jgi:hypothetical protein
MMGWMFAVKHPVKEQDPILAERAILAPITTGAEMA